MSKKSIIVSVVAILLVAALLVLSVLIGDRQYYLISVVAMIVMMIPFFMSFENRKPEARELVTIAVMCAIAVVSRAAFVMLPAVKPIVGIIMIAGIALGPQAGFMTGAISAFVSNFIFGQGPWTPWQMFAFGLAGFIMGILAKKGIIKSEKRLPVSIIGGLLVLIIIGPLLDTCTIFTMSSEINGAAVGAVYLAGIPYNAIHAAATFATLFILCKPISGKLDRIKIKYGMME